MNAELLKQLAQPFAPRHVTWKPGATKGERALALAYADLRAYMRRLDDVCGADWAVSYEPWGDNRLICRLTVMGVTRSSTGETTNESERSEIGGTVAEAQAFKRACAMFGLGRYLYELPALWVGFDPAAKKISKAGQDELDARYQKWYARTMEAQGQPAEAEPEQVAA